ncbi:unnamed protein product [Absidia cylindrospora]
MKNACGQKNNYYHCARQNVEAILDDGKEQSCKHFSYKASSALVRGLLDLNSKEVLHTILFGVAKYLVTLLVKDVMKNDKAKLARLTSMLKIYTGSASYSRVFSRHLTHCGSFLGRDFQCLPLALTLEFSDESDQAIQASDQVGNPFFVGVCTQNLGEYVDGVRNAVLELTTITTSTIEKQHRSVPSRKLTFYTTLGLVYSNRQSTSRDLAVMFGKRAMVRHVIEGGAWCDGNRNNGLVECAQGVKDYIASQSDFYTNFFDGNREFTDNNDIQPTMKNGSYALFSILSPSNSNTNGNSNTSNIDYLIGEVTSLDTKEVTEFNYTGLGPERYLLAVPTATKHDLTNLHVECILDMDITDLNGRHIINHNKFGAYWFLKNVGLL